MFTMNILCEKFAHIRPGQTLMIGSYVAKPKNSIWFHIEHLDSIRKLLKDMGIRRQRMIYRGPRTGNNSFTKKSDAKFFTIW